MVRIVVLYSVPSQVVGSRLDLCSGSCPQDMLTKLNARRVSLVAIAFTLHFQFFSFRCGIVLEPNNRCGSSGTADDSGGVGVGSRWFLCVYIILAVMLSVAAVTIVQRRRGSGLQGHARMGGGRHGASPGRGIDFFGARILSVLSLFAGNSGKSD